MSFSAASSAWLPLDDTALLRHITDESSQANNHQAQKPLFSKGIVFAGRYRIEKFLGYGGMAQIYEATQQPLGRKVALKILMLQSPQQDFRQLFLQEASMVAQLSHPHLVTLLDYGLSEDSGHYYMAMERLYGQSLADALVAQQRFSWLQLLEAALQLSKAMAYSHQQGILHLDLKPANVFLCQSASHDPLHAPATSEKENTTAMLNLKILDFGIARFWQQRLPPETLSSQEEALFRFNAADQQTLCFGTPGYMAPEQILGNTLDRRSDIYSLGVLLYEMLTAVPPFYAGEPHVTLQRQIEGKIPSIHVTQPKLACPPEVEIFLQCCMQKDTLARFDSMEMVSYQVQQLLVRFAGRQIFQTAPQNNPSSPSQPFYRQEEKSGWAMTSAKGLLAQSKIRTPKQPRQPSQAVALAETMILNKEKVDGKQRLEVVSLQQQKLSRASEGSQVTASHLIKKTRSAVLSKKEGPVSKALALSYLWGLEAMQIFLWIALGYNLSLWFLKL